MWWGFFVAVAYGTISRTLWLTWTGVISITITLFNKAVFSWYSFNYPNALTAAQMIFALLFLAALKVR